MPRLEAEKAMSSTPYAKGLLMARTIVHQEAFQCPQAFTGEKACWTKRVV
ncbi:hypothetical protein SAMN04487976_101332 [Xaviernesmea oryzae]|nr:hypothetical protein SAMN04487976_101332 [Xaviernesmea oryzae]